MYCLTNIVKSAYLFIPRSENREVLGSQKTHVYPNPVTFLPFSSEVATNYLASNIIGLFCLILNR